MAYRRIPESEARCYVYTITVDGVVRYVGKGTGRRMAVHLTEARKLNACRARGETVRARKLYNRLAKALRERSDVLATKIAEGLTHTDALARERLEIAAVPAGQLWNATAGGEGVDSATARAKWDDPEYRGRMVAVLRSEGARARAREKALRQFEDPAQRAALSASSQRQWRDPVARALMVERNRVRWGDNEFRERHREAVLSGWRENPERRVHRAAISAAIWSAEEQRRAAAETSKALWKDPDFRRKAMAQWSDPEKVAARAANLTPEFLAERGRRISAGLLRSEKHRNRKRPPTGRKWTEEQRAAHAARMRDIWSDPARRAEQSRRRRGLAAQKD